MLQLQHLIRVRQPGIETLAGPENAKVEVWATRAGQAALKTRYQPVTVADGVTVYGDKTQLVWQAQGFNIWIRPTGSSDAGLPRGKALGRLVKASLEVPFIDDRS